MSVEFRHHYTSRDIEIARGSSESTRRMSRRVVPLLSRRSRTAERKYINSLGVSGPSFHISEKIETISAVRFHRSSGATFCRGFNEMM